MKKPSIEIEALRDDCLALHIKLSLVEEKPKDTRAIAECREELARLSARFQAMDHQRVARPRRAMRPPMSQVTQ